MTIKPYNGLTQYLVIPQSKGEEDYLVDIGFNKGNGKCSCLHFQCRLQPAFARTGKPGEDTRCKHIKAVRQKLAYDLLETFLHTELNKNKQKRTYG